MVVRKKIVQDKSFQVSFAFSFALGVFAMLFFLSLASAAPLFLLSDNPGISVLSQKILRTGAVEIIGLGFLISLGGMAGAFGFGLFLSNRYIGPLARLENWVRDAATQKGEAIPGVREKDLLKNIVESLKSLAKRGVV